MHTYAFCAQEASHAICCLRKACGHQLQRLQPLAAHWLVPCLTWTTSVLTSPQNPLLTPTLIHPDWARSKVPLVCPLSLVSQARYPLCAGPASAHLPPAASALTAPGEPPNLCLYFQCFTTGLPARRHLCEIKCPPSLGWASGSEAPPLARWNNNRYTGLCGGQIPFPKSPLCWHLLNTYCLSALERVQGWRRGWSPCHRDERERAWDPLAGWVFRLGPREPGGGRAACKVSSVLLTGPCIPPFGSRTIHQSVAHL